MNKLFLRIMVVLLLLSSSGLLLTRSHPAYANPDLTITPWTWNIIGLDSNNPTAASGPRYFPVGARICSVGAASAGPITVTFSWDDSNDPNRDYIYTRPDSLTTLTLAPLAADACADAYFEVEVAATAGSFGKTRRYTITATSGAETVRTPQPRELYVEHLISQNRNATLMVRFGTNPANLRDVPPAGSMNLIVGQTYTIELTASTATQGYEQIESFLTLTNTYFQVLGVQTTYTAEQSPMLSNPHPGLYGDACRWENDPASPNYRACLATGKAGGGVTVRYTVRILDAGAGTTKALNSLVYDFSGASFHYNSDYSASVRYANIIDPTSANISKHFSPSTIGAGGVSTLVFTLTNPNPFALSGYSFSDTLPSGVTVVTSVSAVASGCGTPTLAAAGNTITFSNGTVAGGTPTAPGTCTISVKVTAPTPNATPYVNTTSELLLDGMPTGHTASANLTVNDAPLPPACTPGIELARWTMDPSQGTITPPLASFVSPQVSSALARFQPMDGASQTINTAAGQPVNSWSGSGWPRNGDAIPTADTMSYFEFEIDTRNFRSDPAQPVNITFDVYPNAGWASPNNSVYVYSSTDGGAFSNVLTNNTVSRSGWNSGLSAVAATTGDTVRFRINAWGSSTGGPGGPNATLLLDNIVFTGCGIPLPPALSKMFSPNPIAAGGVSRLTFTLTNPNATIALSGASFSDTLPTGMTVNTTAADYRGTSCGGIWSPVAGNNSLSFGGGTIPAGGSCTVWVDVTTSVSGPNTNISGPIATTQTGINSGVTGIATATLTVIQPPIIGKQFSPNPMVAGRTSTLTFTITNPNQNEPVSGVSFTDTFPGGLVVAPVPNASPVGCGGGNWAPAAGATSVSFAGGTIAGGGTCVLTVDVTATQGSYPNSVQVSHVVNTQTIPGNTASSTLTVYPPNPGIALLKQVSVSASGPGSPYLAVAPGAQLFYRLTVENTGDVPLAVNVDDPQVSVAGCSWPNPLPIAIADNNNHIATCVIGPYPDTGATVGEHPNTATATGTSSGYVATDQSTASYATTGLTLLKTPSVETFKAVGETIGYTFTVTNSGFAVLPGPVAVADIRPSVVVSCPALSTVGDLDLFFDPGESVVCTGSYVTTADDVAAGVINNSATASAPGVATSPPSNATVILSGTADLGITKTDGVTTTVPGGTVTYTITASNAGPSAAAGATVADTLPAELTNVTWTCVAAGGGMCTAAGSGNIIDTVNLPVGASVTYTVTATVAGNAIGTLINTATVTAPAGVTDPNPANNSATDTDTVAPQADLSITKTDGVTTVTPGDALTYTITASNAGPSDAVGATVQDPFSAEVTNVTWMCMGAGGGTCTSVGIGNISDTVNLPAGASVTYTVTATVAASAMGTLDNTATVAVPASVTDPTLGNNSATDTDTVAPQADLSITKTDGVTTVTPGSSLTYTITASNAGPSRLIGATVADTFPAELTNVTWICSGAGGGTCTASGSGNINDTVNLPAGGSVTYTVTATVAANATGTLVNTATVTAPASVTDPNPANNSATDTDTLAPQADLSITKTDSPDPVLAGTNLTYTIDVTNAGPSDAVNVAVTDMLPSGVSLISTSGCAEDPNGVPVCTLGTIPAGASTSYTVIVAVDIATSGTVSNIASVTSAAVDPNTGNNQASANSTIIAAADLSITKTESDDPVQPGNALTYTMMVHNAGPATATNVVVTDILPLGMTFTSSSGCPEDPNGVPTCSLGPIPAGTSVSYTIVTTVDASLTPGTVLSNTASVTSDNDPISSNNSATATTAVGVPSADLSITKTDGVTTATPGGSVTYTITVSNTGPSGVMGASVVDSFPASLTGVTWTCVGVGGGSCTAAGSGNINDTVTLPASASVIYTVTATVAANATGTLDNTATVTAPTGVTDPDPANDSATDIDTLAAVQADLRVLKTGPAVAAPDSMITFTIQVFNDGPSGAENVTLNDPTPAGLTFVSATGDCAGGFPCVLASPLAVGSSYSVDVVLSIPVDYLSTPIMNTATVASDAADPNVDNNTATASVPLQATGSLVVTKTPDVSSVVAPGGDVTFTVTVNNPDAVAQWTLTALTDDQFGDLNGQGTCSLPQEIGPAGAYECSFTAAIAGSAGEAHTNTITATGVREAIELTGTGSATVQIVGALVSATKSVVLSGDANGDGIANAGDVLRYSVTLENGGAAAMSNVTYTDTPDANTALVIGSATVSDPVALITRQDEGLEVFVPVLPPETAIIITYEVRIADLLPAGVSSVSNQGMVRGEGLADVLTDDPGTDPAGDPTVISVGEPPTPVEPTVEPVAQPVLPALSVFDPAISKVGILRSGGLGLVGEQLVWEFSITNIGTAAGNNVAVSDAIVPDLRIDSASIEMGTYTIVDQLVTFNIPLLNPGQTIGATITTTVLRSPLNVQNDAYLSGTGPDGAVVVRSARAQVVGVSTLPNTGYPAAEREQSSRRPMVPWGAIGLIGLAACVVMGRRLCRLI